MYSKESTGRGKFRKKCMSGQIADGGSVHSRNTPDGTPEKICEAFNELMSYIITGSPGESTRIKRKRSYNKKHRK